MKKNSDIKEGVIGGVLSGILSSLCCVGPIVIVLLGLGSVSFALSLSQYRPYFLGLGFIFLLGAIVYHLQKKNKSCRINCFSVKGLKQEKKFIVSIILSMGIIYYLALFVLVPGIGPIIYKNAVQKETLLSTVSAEKTGKSPAVDTDTIHAELKKLQVKIAGMTCAGCSAGVQSMLLSLDGIVDAEVSYQDGTGEITYDPNTITKEQIIASNAFSSYPASIVSDEKTNE